MVAERCCGIVLCCCHIVQLISRPGARLLHGNDCLRPRVTDEKMLHVERIVAVLDQAFAKASHACIGRLGWCAVLAAILSHLPVEQGRLQGCQTCQGPAGAVASSSTPTLTAWKGGDICAMSPGVTPSVPNKPDMAVLCVFFGMTLACTF